ncbi:uncharacterized protein LOC114715412 isoform X2 [Neltuma alba]|uniref:uncharacterized protein LOC114715412 isoform X2 n=1 Tax=Neltuma alba TaxID=207710 RepID=UPI0010A58669|nr:uncharacterized protein LOC114715412 isoform X2 [Prosopis alba]
MAAHLTLQLFQLFDNSKSFGLDVRKRTVENALLHSNPHVTEERNDGFSDNNLLTGYWSRCYTAERKRSLISVSAKNSFVSIDQSQSKRESDGTLTTTSSQEIKLNRVNCIVWVLHESSGSFSQAVESLRLPGSGPELAMAWLGKDVHAWHRHIAYQVAVYVLMKTAIDVEILLSHDRQNEFSPVREILTPLRNQMREYIERQLKMRHPDLVQWFRISEIPRLAGYFIPLLKKWSMEYAGSGVAGIIVAITCCTAVVKLGSGHISCPLLISSFKGVLVELMDHSLDLATVDKLHHLATDAGFELDFLRHFGKRILPSEKIEDLEFWIGLAHEKLMKAFHEESIISNMQILQCKPDSLATLGLFAYLGRRTRIFLSAVAIKDLDDMVQDFLSYLECGCIFIYPEFSSIPVYQLFMELVTDEIGWLDFYASYAQINCQEKRSKPHARQAEKEIILYVVFTVCYDIFSGFAHFNRSTQQPLETNLLSYLFRSQGLLSICLQEHRAAYVKSGESFDIVDYAALNNATPSIGGRNGHKLSLAFEAQQKSHDLTTEGSPKSYSQFGSTLHKAPILDKAKCQRGTCVEKIKFLYESFIRRYCIKLVSATTDIWMGTQLLYIDIKVALELLMRQVHGCKVTRRQKKKLERTLTDIITLVPVTVLMLLPVTAVGHAAMLAAIKKYMPFLIPSPYSSERLDVVKQLKRTKEMDDQSWGNPEDPSPTSS